jgi:hypothetical protein
MTKGVMMDYVTKAMNMVVAGLSFSKSKIGQICSDEKNTKPAVFLIAFSVILDAAIAFFQGNGGSSGMGRMGLTGLTAAFAEMGSALIGTFLSAFIMVYVIRIFKVKPTFNEILRVYGVAIIWTILGAVVGLILPEGFALAGVVFWLAYNFSVLFGLAWHTKIKVWQSFLSIVITFIGIFVVVILYGMLIKALAG